MQKTDSVFMGLGNEFVTIQPIFTCRR